MAPNESAVNQEQKEDSKVPKWVTQEYFENICSREIEDFSKISKFVAEPGSGAGENYASIILRVLIECELKDGSKKDFSLMVKAAHPKDSQAGQMVEEMNIFGKENEVYNNIIPAFEQLYLKKGKQVVFGPKSFTFDKDPGVETVVLEDLRPRNFKNVNRLEGLDMDHIKSVLVKLAEYHAASATYFEDIKSIPEKMLKGMLDPEKKELIKPFYELNNPYIIKALTENMDNGEYYAKKMVTDADTMIEHDIKHLGSFDPEEFNVLNHGDCWANNIMFRHNEEGKLEETLLIDFQMCKWGSPAQDLFYFLFTSAKLDLKLKHFDYFIKYYHEKLVENLKLLGYSKPIPSLMELHILLFKNQSWGIFAAIGVMSVVLLDPTEEASMDNFLSDSADGKSFREKLYSTKRFIKAMNDILPWMDNRGALVF